MVQHVHNQVSKYFGLLVVLNAFQSLKPQYMCSAISLLPTKFAQRELP